MEVWQPRRTTDLCVLSLNTACGSVSRPRRFSGALRNHKPQAVREARGCCTRSSFGQRLRRFRPKCSMCVGIYLYKYVRLHICIYTYISNGVYITYIYIYIYTCKIYMFLHIACYLLQTIVVSQLNCKVVRPAMGGFRLRAQAIRAVHSRRRLP